MIDFLKLLALLYVLAIVAMILGVGVIRCGQVSSADAKHVMEAIVGLGMALSLAAATVAFFLKR